MSNTFSEHFTKCFFYFKNIFQKTSNLFSQLKTLNTNADLKESIVSITPPFFFKYETIINL